MENSSVTAPDSTFNASISIISSFSSDVPVVSISSTTYDPEADYFVDKNGKMTSVSLGKLPHFDIDVTGYMVQSQNVSYDTAKTELTNLAAKYE